MMRISLLFIFMMTAASTTFADNDCRSVVDTVKPRFLKTFEESYYPLMCSDNVLKLKMNLLAENVVLDNAYVVVIRHKAAPYVEILPHRPRLTFKDNVYWSPRWSFHMFLVVEGLVFDMDYTDVLKAVGLNTYMRTMWDQNKMADYVVQIKPLDAYLSKHTYGTFSDVDLFGAHELIEKLSDLPCNQSESIDF